MRVAAIKELSLVDGKGVRFTIFMSGCPHSCDGCQNPDFQSYTYGTDWAIKDMIQKIKDMSLWHDGITLTGGDPLFQLNETISFLRAVRRDSDLKDISIWLYTGYKFEDIPNDVTRYCDVIIDGKYMKDLPRAKWRGSNNQRIMIRNPGGEGYEEYKNEYDEHDYN